MRNRNRWVTYVVLGLLALGIIASIFSNPSRYIIPLLVFGVIFWLYKYPPNRWRNKSNNARFSKTKRRNASFRVIRGNKDSSDEPPKYH